MRSTRASNALARLKTRTGDQSYAMQIAANGMFSLMQTSADGQLQAVSPPLELDEFVRFVNAAGPQTPKRVSKLDVAFEKQLLKRGE